MIFKHLQSFTLNSIKLRGQNTSEQKDLTSLENIKLKPLYVRSVVNSLGLGMVNPFLSPYAVELGASPSEMGWFQSLSNLSNNVMQVFGVN